MPRAEMPMVGPSMDEPRAGRRGRPVSLEKRRAMLDAAVAEFRALGYQAASMDAVAAAAGVSKRTLYNHFPSKEVLFRSLAEEMAKRVSLFSRLDYRPDVPIRVQLLEYAHDSARLIDDPETLALYRAVLAEHVRTPALVECVMARYWGGEYGFADWIRAARDDGKLRVASPERAGQLFASLVKGVAVWPVVFNRAEPAPAEREMAIAEAIDMFLAYYGA